LSPDLINWLGEVSADPLAFVLGAFPWGEPNSRLAKFTGPEAWQSDLLGRIRDGLLTPNQAIQEATASGHGVGKSAVVSWIILWAMSTMPDTRGVVTANTETQLKTKTWAELGKWYHMCLTKDMFKFTATALFSTDEVHERTWRLDMVPWSERNTEAFAGLHNQGRRILVIFDEASAIPDVIWETTEGALTDDNTQIIWCVFGNPTRNVGRFKECFEGGQFASIWHSRQVDSRIISFTNKAQIDKWIKSYGDDSDFVRIRVYGMFPRVGEMEFFNASDVEAAMVRDVYVGLGDPLALGVDVARYGKNSSVIFPRKGRDARTLERKRFQGLDTTQLADKIFEVNFTYHADGIFIDGGGVGGGVVDQTRAKALHCYEVQFGAKDDTPHVVFGSQGERYANKRSGIYGACRSWLKTGAIPNDPEIRKQFNSIKYVINKRDEIQLISKEDMLKLDPDLELDDIDALVTTFAYALQPNANAGGPHAQFKNNNQSEYNPFDEARLIGGKVPNEYNPYASEAA
jgi:hypothetical protein